MPCLGCGRPWDGTSMYCPACTVRTVIGEPCAMVPSLTDQKMDTIIEALRVITRLLQSIEYQARTA